MKQSPSGNLRAQRDVEASKFFGRKIKNAGPDNAAPFSPPGKPLIARGDAIVGTLPKGPDTTGGCVGGLKDSDSYQGMKAGRS